MIFEFSNRLRVPGVHVFLDRIESVAAEHLTEENQKILVVPSHEGGASSQEGRDAVAVYVFEVGFRERFEVAAALKN